MIIEKYLSILFFLLIIVSCERDSEKSIDIQGCLDETACNYDSSATIDDGNCEYISCQGCMDQSACNYDSSAIIDDGSCVFADQYCNGDCDYTHFESLPSSLTILSGDSCLYNPDISVLDSIIGLNGLEYDSPLEVGTQTWYNGRLRIFVAGNYGNSSGVNDTIYFLPDNIGDWTELVSLYLEWNRILTLPESFSDMTSLINLYINNNVLSSLPDNLGSLENLYFLDLGYNELPLVPESICNLGNLTYLWLFNNNLESVPECMCEMDLDWNNNDLGGYPYFAIGANMLCDNVDSCVAESEHFELSLDQFYYSFPVYSPQVCDSTSTALNKNPILY